MNEPSSVFQTAFGRQRGAALLIFMLIFFMASMSLLLSRADVLRSRASADQTTSAALAQAREALIGRAVADKERPGSLPCPDFDDDGEATNGSCPVTVGRLPWRTLGLPDLRDGDGNRLWYVLASELQDNDDAPGIDINPELDLGLALDGEENIAAIVFSAGPPVAEQNGRPSDIVKDYLEGENADEDRKEYVSGPASDTFNDKAIAISRDHLFKVVSRGVLGLIGAELNNYYNGAKSYPNVKELEAALSPPDDLDESKLSEKEKKELENLKDLLEVLAANEWFKIIKYTAAPDQQSATLAIDAPPKITCAITPKQKPSCTRPQ